MNKLICSFIFQFSSITLWPFETWILFDPEGVLCSLAPRCQQQTISSKGGKVSMDQPCLSILLPQSDLRSGGFGLGKLGSKWWQNQRFPSKTLPKNLTAPAGLPSTNSASGSDPPGQPLLPVCTDEPLLPMTLSLVPHCSQLLTTADWEHPTGLWKCSDSVSQLKFSQPAMTKWICNCSNLAHFSWTNLGEKINNLFPFLPYN